MTGRISGTDEGKLMVNGQRLQGREKRQVMILNLSVQSTVNFGDDVG
jgi:hypothetical protein